jgi:hypothetical protein
LEAAYACCDESYDLQEAQLLLLLLLLLLLMLLLLLLPLLLPLLLTILLLQVDPVTNGTHVVA